MSFDADGYPTDETLDQIEKFKGSLHDYIDLIIANWSGNGQLSMDPEADLEWRGKGTRLVLVTGGWSGNESIIGAMAESIFWVSFWESSTRGGKFVFEIPDSHDRYTEDQWWGNLWSIPS